MSLASLQSTTALIGVGTGVGAALSAINLWQTLQLREDVKQLKLEVRDGFIDLKKALHNQGNQIIEYMEVVANDIKFEQHRLELIKAYGHFWEASKLIKISLACNDNTIKNADLANARQTLGEALAMYKNPHLLSETSTVGKLRRFECAWAIEQTIALTYQLQNETRAVSNHLEHLKNTILQDCLTVIDSCSSQEVDFIFPEITHIYNNDLVIIDAWNDYIDWSSLISPKEIQSLKSIEIKQSEEVGTIEVAKPSAIVEYESLQKNSHLLSLKDQLKFLFISNLRSEYETYIRQKARQNEQNGLVSSNLEQASDAAIANLYWYFKAEE